MEDQHIAHHGIKGMKWGVRRFQNADGSYTAAGKARYGKGGEVGGPLLDNLKRANAPRDRANQSSRAREQRAVKRALASQKAKDAAQAVKDKAASVDDGTVGKANSINSGVNQISSGVNRLSRAGNESNRYASNHKTLSAEEMANTSDADLQRIINRLNMETNYTRLTSEPSALDKVATGLECVAALTSIAAGGVAVYNAIKK